MEKRRFSGVEGRDYRLFLAARPHYRFMQSLIRLRLAAYQGRKEGPISVLEIGCGQGDTSREILRSGRLIRLVGVDNEPVMLRKARKALARDIKGGRVRLVRSDALAFLRRLPPSSADVVASAFTLHNLTKGYRRSLHAQIFRVLRDGGLFINADKFASDDAAEHRAALAWQLGKFSLFLRGGRPDLQAAWERHYMDDEWPARIMRASLAVRELEGLGFGRVRLSHRRHLEALLTAWKPISRSRKARR